MVASRCRPYPSGTVHTYMGCLIKLLIQSLLLFRVSHQSNLLSQDMYSTYLVIVKIMTTGYMTDPADRVAAISNLC